MNNDASNLFGGDPIPTDQTPNVTLPDALAVDLTTFFRAFRFGPNPIVNLRILPPKVKSEPKPTKEDLAKFEKAKVPYFAWRQSILDPYGVKAAPFNLALALSVFSDKKNRDLKQVWKTNAGLDARAPYFVVNQGGQKKDDIDQATAFFLESDDKPIEQQYTEAMSFPIVPNVIVKTKSSLHCYWLAIEGTDLEMWDAVQRTLILYANSDPAIKDRPRVMRVPGYDHTTFDFETGETTRVPVTLLRFEPEQRVGAGQMIEMLSDLGRPEVAKDEFTNWLHERNGTNKQRSAIRERRIPAGGIYQNAAPPENLQSVYSDICARLDIVGPAGEYSVRATCPSCQDPSPSLIVSLTPDKILMTDHAMCTFGEICDAIGVDQKLTFAKRPAIQLNRPRGDRPAESNPQATAAGDDTEPDGDFSPEGMIEYADEVYSQATDGETLPESVCYAGSQDPVMLAAATWEMLAIAERRRPTLFIFNEIMVRLCQSKKDLGALTVHGVNIEMFRYRLNRLARWWKKTQFGTEVDCPAPSFLIADMMATPLSETNLPLLNHITPEPVFDPAGKLVNIPGFHWESGIYYTPRFSPLDVPEVPSDAEMIAARDYLTDLISDFPFEDSHSRDNAIAMGLVPFVREMIAGPVPLGFLTAAVPRTGKTKLLKVLLGAGNYSMITYSNETAEMRKAITTSIMEGRPNVLIDNVNENLDSAPLAAVLTGDTWNDRILGTNQSCSAVPRNQWLATANNPTTSREISGRSVVCRIVAESDRPEERSDFKIADIEAYARDNRPRIVQAFITLAAYWIGKGKPAPQGIKLGGFEDYVRVVGGILQTCGLTLLKNYRETSDALDSERSAVASFVNCWWTEILNDGTRTTPQKAGKLWDFAKDLDGLPHTIKDERSMGYWLKSLHERRVEYRGPERDPIPGETAEEIPEIIRRFIIRKCPHMVSKSSVYEIELTGQATLATLFSDLDKTSTANGSHGGVLNGSGLAKHATTETKDLQTQEKKWSM